MIKYDLSQTQDVKAAVEETPQPARWLTTHIIIQPIFNK
jgi:hypothetical protein